MTRFTLIIGLLAALLCSCASTANLSPEQKEAREQEKRINAIRDSIAHEVAVQSLDNLDFVHEAGKLIFKRGRSAYVSPSTNFISVVNGKATVQIAVFKSIPGINGIGGITVEGTPSYVKKSVDKKGNYSLSMSVSGTGISATVHISLPSGSTYATAVITPNFHSYNITLQGTVIPASASNVYKARPL